MMGFAQVGEPPPNIEKCAHFVFHSHHKYMGREYVRQEFKMEPPAGSYTLNADVMRILNGHFKFVGPVAFAPTLESREGARAAVEDFLRARRPLA